MPTDNWMFSLQDLQTQLPDDPGVLRFQYGLRHGTMKVGLYAPRGQGAQTPHRQDELYLVISGTGEFIKNQERRRFKPYDVIVVEAGAEHRFEKFSDDFSAWVIFWRSENGAS